MIAQIFTDLGQMVDRGDTVAAKLLVVADPGQHQQLRRIHRSGTQHHLATYPNDLSAAVLFIFDPGRSGALKDHPGGGGLGDKRQVLSPQRRPQVGLRCAPGCAATRCHTGLMRPVFLGHVGPFDPVAALPHRVEPGHRG
jgi:hypothetical protein